MKKYIEYYYSLHINQISFDSSRYYILANNEKYIFKKLNLVFVGDNYNRIKSTLGKYNCFFDIVNNKYGNLITTISDEQYVLLRLTNIPNETISLYDIKNDIYIDGNLVSNFREEWIKKWEQKIDYFEELLANKKEFYNELYPAFQYYIGIGEESIAYLKSINDKDADIPVIQHHRLKVSSNLYYYYDPTNIIIDHCSRDIAEYIKSVVINSDDIEEFIMILDEYLNSRVFSNYDIKMMYARILFPTFFFDYVEEIEMSSKKRSKGKELVHTFENIALCYENGIRYLNKLFKEKYSIPIITA